MFVTMKKRLNLKVGHVGSNTRSLGLILERSCVHSRKHSFDPICNFVTIKSWTNLKLCHVGSKSRPLDQILAKPFLHSKGLKVLFQYLCFFRMFICMKSRGSLRLDEVRLSTRSLGQIYKSTGNLGHV